MSPHTPAALSGLVGSRFDAVLFDMDGTLIDSTQAVERAWERWSLELGIRNPFGKQGHGRPAEDLVREVVAPDVAEAAVTRLRQMEEDDTDGVIAFPGVQRLLSSFPAANWAIVTSCTRNLAFARLAAAGLPFPMHMITFDDVNAGKPSPDPFLLAARRLGVDPARCLVVEDTVAGLISGRAAGCTTLAVTGTQPLHELRAHSDHVVLSLEKLVLVARGNAVEATGS
ncbi:HAD-IA family hydrolase [Cryobacterium sp. N21]|uniref:HAD-IA family hydrolase n=1 Tax=Cryobacterium sp. N21 TaxID=2048289 RepID=UPI0018ED0A4C|nr:HAD-IA family hydrolase [Cryobacterium sp. N21]